MRCAYVGIVSRYGLESLHAEEWHTTAFLLRRAERMQPRGAVCFWTVMEPEIAEQIRTELAWGNRAHAILLLQTLAYEVGRVLPEESDTVAVILE